MFLPSKFIRDLISTTITSVVTIVCLVVLMRVLAIGLGPDDFGAFSLVRRIFSTIEPLSSLAMGVAITRFVALYDDTNERNYVLLAGCLLSLVFAVLLFAVFNVFSIELGSIIFHDQVRYSDLFFSMTLMFIGYSIFISVYAFYRGVGEMGKANLWQLLVIAVGPLIASFFYSSGDELAALVLLFAILMYLAIIPLFIQLRKICIRNFDKKKLEAHLRSLFFYGMPRVPGYLLYGALLAVGPLWAPYMGSLREAGYLVIGQSILRIVESGTEAFGRVALPKITALHNKNGKHGISGEITNLVSFLIHIGIFATIHLYIWTDLIVVVWLGENFIEAAWTIKILILSILPFLMFVTLRTVIDAVEVKAVITLYLLVGFLVTIATSFLLSLFGIGAISLAIGTSCGIFVLGVLVSVRVFVDFKLKLSDLAIVKCVIANAVLFLVSYVVFLMLASNTFSFKMFVSVIFIETGLFCFYLYALNKFKVAWLRSLMTRLWVPG